MKPSIHLMRNFSYAPASAATKTPESCYKFENTNREYLINTTPNKKA